MSAASHKKILQSGELLSLFIQCFDPQCAHFHVYSLLRSNCCSRLITNQKTWMLCILIVWTDILAFPAVTDFQGPCVALSLFTQNAYLFQMLIYERATSGLVVKGCMSFNRWCCSHQGKGRLERMSSRLFLRLQSKQAPSPSVKCNVPAISSLSIQLAVTSPSAAHPPLSVCLLRLPPFPFFFSFLSLPRTVSHRRRLNPLFVESSTKSWTALRCRGICVCVFVCVPWNLNLCSNPEFLFYFHGNAVPSSSCPTLLRIISHPFMKLHHALYRNVLFIFYS